jgi:hypothetical protein
MKIIHSTKGIDRVEMQKLLIFTMLRTSLLQSQDLQYEDRLPKGLRFIDLN